MKDTANNNERKYNFIEKIAGRPEIDKQLAEVNEELNKTKRNGAIAVAATAVVGAASTIGAAMIVKKKLEPKYMTLPQIINLGKYAEYKELVNAIDTAMTDEATKKAIAEKSEATKEQKENATEATKKRKEAEEKMYNFMRLDKKEKKEKKEKKNKEKDDK